MLYTFASNISILVALVLTIISFFVGVLGGLVGLALGTIRLPAMLLLGIDPRIAAGTNIITSSVSSFFGAVKHIREKNINKQIILFMGIPATAGTFIGGLLSPHVPIDLLLISVGILVLWQGIEFIILGLSKKQKISDALGTNIDSTKGKFNKTSIAIECSLGLSIGTLGGAVGLILGSIRLPAIIRILKIDPRIAAGSNLFIGFFMGIAGVIGHSFNNQVDYGLMILMTSSAALGSYLGANYSNKISINKFVLILGIVLSIVGLILTTRPILA